MINDEIKQKIEASPTYSYINEAMSNGGVSEFITEYINQSNKLILSGSLVLENEYSIGSKIVPVLRVLPVTIKALKRAGMTDEEVSEEITERIKNIINNENK